MWKSLTVEKYQSAYIKIYDCGEHRVQAFISMKRPRGRLRNIDLNDSRIARTPDESIWDSLGTVRKGPQAAAS